MRSNTKHRRATIIKATEVPKRHYQVLKKITAEKNVTYIKFWFIFAYLYYLFTTVTKINFMHYSNIRVSISYIQLISTVS